MGSRKWGGGGWLCRHSSTSLHHSDGGITEQLEKDSQPVSSSEMTFITEQGERVGKDSEINGWLIKM